MEFNHPDELKKDSKEEYAKNEATDFTVDFATFIISMSSSALVALGELPDPISKVKKVNVVLAKQMIDVINMLRDKTKGNLTNEEEELISGLCSELKMKYLRVINFK